MKLASIDITNITIEKYEVKPGLFFNNTDFVFLQVQPFVSCTK